MNISWFYSGYVEHPTGLPIRCIRNDGGLLRGSPGPSLHWAACRVCDLRVSPVLLEEIPRSSWEALRLGFQPIVQGKRLTMSFDGGSVSFSPSPFGVRY